MLNRRIVMAGAAALGLVAVSLPAVAQDWKARYPELVFAVVPAENASGVMDRWAPFVRYLEREIGTKVTIRVAQDYAAVIEGQRAGQIHIGYHGPASYARARMTGAQIEPFAMDVNADGSKGYYSVFYVKADSPYQKIEDLKGKRLGLVDPNSASGNNIPRYALDKMGIKPQEFFSNVINTGSHENAIIALGQGTVDVATNWWNSEADSNLTRMATKNMAKVSDFRIIFRSDLIVNSPYTYLSNMPQDLKDRIRNAWLQASVKDKEAFDRLSDGKNMPFEIVTHEAYLPIIEVNQFVDRLRRQGS
ncbi:MAG: phosphonate ABC transporter substrate-binding protein [Rhodospirillales bacterium]|jgi:phosphonate transport system substrate-binding protein